MSTNRPTLPADGAALLSVSVSASVPLTATINMGAVDVDPQADPFVWADVRARFVASVRELFA
jgi:hypothetical protein